MAYLGRMPQRLVFILIVALATALTGGGLLSWLSAALAAGSP